MVPRTLLPALAAVALGTTADAQTPCERPQSADSSAAVHQLRNVAAADVAHALNAVILKQNLSVIAVPEPVSNTVLLAGAPGDRKRVAEQLAAIDQPPPTAVIQLLILRTPTGFAEETGLGEGNETKWVLTPQEARMLTVAIRREKVQGRIDVLSRPRLTLADNQTGFFQVGQPAQQLSTVVQTAAGTAHQPVAYTDGGIVSRMTPRINPDGTVLLRGETQVSTVNPVSVDLGGGTRARAVDTQSIETAGLIPKGGALVVRGGRSKAADGGVTEVMLVLTADRVQAQPAK